MGAFTAFGIELQHTADDRDHNREQKQMLETQLTETRAQLAECAKTHSTPWKFDLKLPFNLGEMHYEEPVK